MSVSSITLSETLHLHSILPFHGLAAQNTTLLLQFCFIASYQNRQSQLLSLAERLAYIILGNNIITWHILLLGKLVNS